DEQGVMQDARAARAWLAQRAAVDEKQVVLLGESLGGGAAVGLAAEVPPRALVLQSTFTSMPDVAAVHYPFLPARLLMDTRFDSLAKIASYHGPVFSSHGERDEIVPLAQGRRLFDAAPSSQKRFLEISGAGHNDALPPDYYRELAEFLQALPGDERSP
ncbi:MAG: alpha/beta hydrolase, partial [Planctomycetales bacterium]|nr:alpha/beta hydrolase [Planctomycetales bacterium]